MAASRKPRPTLARDLGPLIEKLATGKAGSHELEIDITGTSAKLVTDRIRRVPRVKGWHALSVEGGTVMGHVLTITVTNTGELAVPWPKKAAAAKPEPKPAAKPKQTAAQKRSASKKATEARVRELKAQSAAKTPAKRTRKAAVK